MVNRVVPLAELQEASLRYAKRLSLISPEALYVPNHTREVAAVPKMRGEGLVCIIHATVEARTGERGHLFRTQWPQCQSPRRCARGSRERGPQDPAP